jgi:hypothetical protein
MGLRIQKSAFSLFSFFIFLRWSGLLDLFPDRDQDI